MTCPRCHRDDGTHHPWCDHPEVFPPPEMTDEEMWGELRTVTLARTLADGPDAKVTVGAWMLRDLLARIDRLSPPSEGAEP